MQIKIRILDKKQLDVSKILMRIYNLKYSDKAVITISLLLHSFSQISKFSISNNNSFH